MPRNNTKAKKEAKKWYPIISEAHLIKIMHREGIFEWLDIYKVSPGLMKALEADFAEFVNRTCRAVYLSIKK